MRITRLAHRIAPIAIIGACAIATTACGDDAATPTATIPTTSTSTPHAQTTTPAPATPVSPPRIEATPLVEVTGLFTEPRDIHIDAYRTLGPKPSPFADWDRTSTMLYDIEAGTETNLGPGSLGRFSPDNTKMVWIANPQPPFSDGEAWMIEIASGAKRDLGPGRLANFIDDDQVAIANTAGRNDSFVLDLRTGDRRDQSDLAGTFPVFDDRTTPDGFVLTRGASTNDRDSTFWLEDAAQNRVLLTFVAWDAKPAGHQSLLVAVMPAGQAPASMSASAGTMNLFLIDITTGAVTFVATTTPDARYAAGDDYVLWTDAFCTMTPGNTKMLDRATGRITQLDASLAPTFVTNGLILDGLFGGRALIDSVTLEYRAVIPARGDSSWSSDYRYASVGQFGGHGGC